MNLLTISAIQAKEKLTTGTILVDIRETNEYQREHIEGAISLSSSQEIPDVIKSATQIILYCQSGIRTQQAAEQLVLHLSAPIFLMEHGIQGWKKAGFSTIFDRKHPISIGRQVQIGAGSLVLLGIVLGTLVSPKWLGLSAFVGIGLVFAGMTGFCGMAVLLAKTPWNKQN